MRVCSLVTRPERRSLVWFPVSGLRSLVSGLGLCIFFLDRSRILSSLFVSTHGWLTQAAWLGCGVVVLRMCEAGWEDVRHDGRERWQKSNMEPLLRSHQFSISRHRHAFCVGRWSFRSWDWSKSIALGTRRNRDAVGDGKLYLFIYYLIIIVI